MTYYHRNLPHVHPKGAIFFITFRLYGSIPLVKLELLRSDYEKDLRKLKIFHPYTVPEFYHDKLYALQKKYFAEYDNLLDSR